MDASNSLGSSITTTAASKARPSNSRFESGVNAIAAEPVPFWESSKFAHSSMRSSLNSLMRLGTIVPSACGKHEISFPEETTIPY